MSVIKQLLGQTAMYGISSMLGRAINFLLVPFYTALLLPDAYGVVTDLYAYAAFLIFCFYMGWKQPISAILQSLNTPKNISSIISLLKLL